MNAGCCQTFGNCKKLETKNDNIGIVEQCFSIILISINGKKILNKALNLKCIWILYVGDELMTFLVIVLLLIYPNWLDAVKGFLFFKICIRME